jgi:long-chain acyl-CoA synthetase
MRGSLLEFLFDISSLENEIAFSHRPRLRRKNWTYAQIARTAFQFARELRSRGIGHGDRVLIWAENSPEWVAAFYGVLLRGAIAVPLDEQSSLDFVERVSEQTDPKLLLHDQNASETKLQIPSLSLAELPEKVARFSSEQYDTSDIKLSDTVEIVFTSGTTAAPKGVILTHENLLANLEPIEREIRKYIKWEFLVHPIRILNVLPLSHLFGQMVGIFIPRMLGATVIFQQRLGPSEIVETIKRERVSVLAATPRVLETLRHKVERDQRSRGRLETFRQSMDKERSWVNAWWKFRREHRMFGLKFLSFVTGGATLDETTENFWRKLGFAVIQGYGMTETAALVSLNNPFSSRRGSLGQILTGRENVKIGEKGEILVRGRNISPGYWGEQTNGSNSEWLDTGDVGAMDETGRLYFKGRKKEVIVTAAGLNIYPDDLEAALNGQPEIVDSAVVAVEGDNGPDPVAALILRPGSDAAAVVERANKRLAPFQQIRRWVEWPDADFPRTSTQKIRRTDVAAGVAVLLNGPDAKSKADGSPLKAMLARLSGLARPDADLRLDEDLDLDSLSRVELMSAIEDRYQIDLDEETFTSTTTVGEIEELIRNEGAPDHGPKFSYPRWTLRFPISLIRPIFYELAIYPITRILGRVKTRGLENLRGLKGPVVFASNHVTYIDPALIMSAMPRRFRDRLAIAMDGERLRAYLHPPKAAGFIKRIRWLSTYPLVIIFFNAFPLPRRSGFRRSFDYAGEAMDRGYNILVFPEGELTRRGDLQKFKGGIGILADGLEAPVVPVYISGLYELRNAGQRGWAPPGSVTITFGKPLLFDKNASAQELTREIENRIRVLQEAGW